ncbi:hypothetical protein ABZP36_034551 [Zizania latifolia]
MTQLLRIAGAYFLLVLSMSLDAPPRIMAAESAAAMPPPVSFSFDFSASTSYRLEDLIFDGDAHKPKHGVVSLTVDKMHSTGRMSYAYPVQLYDNTTGTNETASFSTRFTFAIRTVKNSCRGDGMAFFLTSYPSVLPSDSAGNDLGLIAGINANDGQTSAIGKERFVAVEFDTFKRNFDPSSDHIGIDINSVSKSPNTTILPNSSLNGTMTASIAFNSSTNMLVASLWFGGHPSSAKPDYEVSALLTDPDIKSLLPPQVAVGFSAATGDGYASTECIELHQLMSWSFNSTLALIKQDQNMKITRVHVMLIIGGGALVLVLVVWFSISCWILKRNQKAFDNGTGGATRRFEYADLAAATNNFSEKLGQGAFGVVYKGKLKQLGCEVAVKKILKEVSGGHKDFFTEVRTISGLKHQNLVKFLGWCCRGYSSNILHHLLCCWSWRRKNDEELFLVYELVENGNLNDHLYKGRTAAVPTVLTWPIRYNIAKGIGSALRYLHHDCKPYILHRDIKPDNILLDKAYNAKLADFGLSRMANQDNTTLQTRAVGPEGYMDPQCRQSGTNVRFNRSSDVYSFGIVLLGIACTRKVRQQIWDLYKDGGDVVEAADPSLLGTEGFNRWQIERVIILGLWCSFTERGHRPDMWRVMDVLDHGGSLPDLISVVKSTPASECTNQDASGSSASNYSDEAPLFSGRSSS